MRKMLWIISFLSAALSLGCSTSDDPPAQANKPIDAAVPIDAADAASQSDSAVPTDATDAAAPLDASDADKPTQSIEVVVNDIPYQTDKYLRIGYTLKTFEYEKDDLKLEKIIVLDKDTSEQVYVIDNKNLPTIHKEPIKPSEFFTWDKLTNYYLSIQLPIALGKTPPKNVTHQFVFTNTTTKNEVTVTGGNFSPRTSETPVVIASPLKENNLMFVNQSTMAYHFYVLFLMDGGIFRPERYAVDTLELKSDFTNTHDGDPTVNASYFNYGSKLHAVADGVITHIQDGLPENRGDAADVKFKSFLEYAGNYIVLDIGNGRYATYCHCIPQSFLVKVGDKVKEGDAIALLGNSGNSSEPHLHFQITDGPEFVKSNGVPFVLKEYTKIAEMAEPPVTLTPTRVTNALMEEAIIFKVE